jgi:hypothetical protein
MSESQPVRRWAGFTLRVYARDGRDESSVVEDVLSRVSGADIGG